MIEGVDLTQDRTLALLRRSGRLAAIVAGPTQGERVIVYPSDQVISGARIDARPSTKR
jgi:hypothetical protein